MKPFLSSRVAVEVIITTTSGAASDDKVRVVENPGFSDQNAQ